MTKRTAWVLSIGWVAAGALSLVSVVWCVLLVASGMGWGQ